MDELRPDLVKRRPRAPEIGLDRQRCRKRKVFLVELSERVEGEQTPERRAGRNAAPVIAAEAEHVFGELVEARQVIVGHADQAVPFRFEPDVADLREKLLERPLCPGSMNRNTGSSECAATSEHEATGPLEAKRTQHLIGVPGALPFGKNGCANVVRQRL